VSAEALVIKAGIATTVQDLGRRGFGASGVPASGALDPLSIKLANLVAGNACDAAALEMLYSGVALEVRGGAIRVALGGANATIESRESARRELRAWHSALVQPGERLRVGAIRDSAAAYLAIEGGFDVRPVLGSRSTYVRGGLGGWNGRALRPADVLPLVQPHASERVERELAAPPRLESPAVLRVISGPHAARFTDDALRALLSSEYKVSTASDRTGLRLDGPALAHAGSYDLLSEGMVPGSIQVPGSRQPVILIADHATVGGYPRIATIISADLAAAGRLRIGSSIRFELVDAVQAKRARIEHEATYAQLAASIRDAAG
jgi:biotin-dependent carboxylase-like uncharacterized protein